MLVSLTHRILHAVSPNRPPGMPASECRGTLVLQPQPAGAEAHFQLFWCPGCGRMIATHRRPREEWDVVNEYEAESAALVEEPPGKAADREPTSPRPGARPAGRKSRRAIR